MAIGRAELFSSVNALAYQDPLTGLANRRALEERLETAVARASAVERAARAAVLRPRPAQGAQRRRWARGRPPGAARAAEALSAAPPRPIPAPSSPGIAGDEFCVLLEGHSAQDARALAQDAERRLERKEATPLRMSCGAAELQEPGQRPADLFRAADAAQYVAKRAGRGRVYVAEAGVNAGARGGPGPKARRAHARRRRAADARPARLRAGGAGRPALRRERQRSPRGGRGGLRGRLRRGRLGHLPPAHRATTACAPCSKADAGRTASAGCRRCASAAPRTSTRWPTTRPPRRSWTAWRLLRAHLRSAERSRGAGAARVRGLPLERGRRGGGRRHRVADRVYADARSGPSRVRAPRCACSPPRPCGARHDDLVDGAGGVRNDRAVSTAPVHRWLRSFPATAGRCAWRACWPRWDCSAWAA